MSIYAAKFVGAGAAPSGWTKFGSVAVDTTGIVTSSDYPFTPGLDESYDTNGYIIISDTTTAGLVGRTTGNNTGVADPDTPTYWASLTKTEQSFLDVVNLLPARIGQSPFIDGGSALTWLNSNGYWSSYVDLGDLVMFLSGTSSIVGTNLNDLTPFSNDSTISGTFYEKYYNDYKVLKFDGTNGFIQSPSFGTTLDNKFTFETWVLAATTSNGTIISEWGGPAPHGWCDAQSAFVGGKINIGVFSGGSIPGPTFSVNTWYNVVSVYTGSNLKLYVDGALIATQNIVKASPGDTYLTLGRFDESGTYIGGATGYLNGYVGHWKIYNYDLSALEISSAYNQYKTVYDNSLVLNVDAGNVDSYPGSGTTWTDLSLKGNNGTITNATFTTLSGVDTFSFDGSGDYVSIGQPLQTGSSYSISAWINANTTTGSLNIVSSENSPFWIANGTLYAGVGGNYMAVSSGSFPTGVWKFVSMTFNNTTNTMKLFINGTLISTNSSVSQSYTSEITFIGSHYYGGSPTSYWNGYIASVSIYNRALSDTEVSSHFERTRSTYGV
jgi:Concanavalin A-like lectin/glucanases superfamily